MAFELADPTGTLLRKITNKEFIQDDIAKTYALALQTSVQTDWARVNDAIIVRWNKSALKYIKCRAGRCSGQHTKKENDMDIDETVQSLSARTQELVTETCNLVAYLDDQTGYNVRNIRRMTQTKMAMWRLEDARMHLDEVPRCTAGTSIQGE